jgi:hypothetical protein
MYCGYGSHGACVWCVFALINEMMFVYLRVYASADPCIRQVLLMFILHSQLVTIHHPGREPHQEQRHCVPEILHLLSLV